MATPPGPPPGMAPPPPVDVIISGYSKYIATQAAFVAIATASVIARLYVRFVIIRSIGFDELCIVIAWMFSIPTLTITSIMVNDREQFIALDAQFSSNQLPGLIGQEISPALTILSITFTKISICFFLPRIVASGKKWKSRTWKWGLFTIMAVAVLTGVPCAIVTICQCKPIPKLWNPMMPGTCWSPSVALYVGYFYGPVSVALDWALATLPVVFMWNVQIKIHLKIGICVLMGLGYFTGICAVVKTVLLSEVGGTTLHGDLTNLLLSLGIWAILEVNVGILAASIPTLRPLFSRTMREEHYRKRQRRGSPGSSNERQYQNKHSKDNLVLFDTPKLSQPSSRSDSDAHGRALGMNRSHESSAYPHEVPSAFDNV